MVIWFRNMFLNQLMLVPFLASFSLLAIAGGILRARLAAHDIAGGWLYGVVIGVFALAATVIAAAGSHRIDSDTASVPRRSPDGPLDGTAAALSSTTLLLGASVLIAHMSSRFKLLGSGALLWWMFVIAAFLIFILQAGGGYLDCYRRRHPGKEGAAALSLVAWPVVAGAVTAGLFYGAIHWIAAWEGASAGTWHVIGWGPPLIMLAWMASAGFHIGLMGADFPDYGREWFARVGAYMGHRRAWMGVLVCADDLRSLLVHGADASLLSCGRRPDRGLARHNLVGRVFRR